MSNGPTLFELKDRLSREIAHFQGVMPERVALVWEGYLAALLEWELISVSDHAEACSILPEIQDNPVIAIFLGRGD